MSKSTAAAAAAVTMMDTGATPDLAAITVTAADAFTAGAVAEAAAECAEFLAEDGTEAAAYEPTPEEIAAAAQVAALEAMRAELQRMVGRSIVTVGDCVTYNVDGCTAVDVYLGTETRKFRVGVKGGSIHYGKADAIAAMGSPIDKVEVDMEVAKSGQVTSITITTEAGGTVHFMILSLETGSLPRVTSKHSVP